MFYLQHNYQAAANAYRDALNGDGDPRWTEVWSHVQLGKIFDVTGQRERAVNEYRRPCRPMTTRKAHWTRLGEICRNLIRRRKRVVRQSKVTGRKSEVLGRGLIRALHFCLAPGCLALTFVEQKGRTSMLKKSLIVTFLCVLPLIAVGQNRPITLAYQLTHSVNMDPTISPDGKEMIYISILEGKEQFFRSAIDGTGAKQLTHDDANHEDPAWSPDGKKIAFVLIEEGVEQIHLMDVDGTHVEPLAPADHRTIHPNWAPDGRSVAYCTDD